MRKILAIILAFLFFAGCTINKQKSTVGESGGEKETSRQDQGDASLQGGTGTLKVHFLDVGQGDSILVQFPDGRNMLVDTGGNDSARIVVDYLKKNGVKKLDFLVGTHPHEDHIGAMDTIVKNIPVGEIFMPMVTSNTQTFRDVMAAIKKKGLKIATAKAGVDILKNDNLSVKILAPNKNAYEDLNNYSAVLKVKYGEVSFLLTGDAEELSEQEILVGGADVEADVLKVGHHGSRSSTSPAFLKAVRPLYAVISVGAGNDYRHPHRATLERLGKAGADVLRTDQKGTIVFATDGKEVSPTASKQ